MEKTHIVLVKLVNSNIVTTAQGVIVIDTSGSPEGAQEGKA